MKKIGLITVQRAMNYGAQLQCYATQRFLNEKGYECVIIDLSRPCHKEYVESSDFVQHSIQRKPFKKNVLDLLRKIKRFIWKNLFNIEDKHSLFLQRYNYLLDDAKKKFAEFESLMPSTRCYNSISELYKDPPIFDVYLTGSDQLWNPTQPYCLEPYFLSFAPNGAFKVSYATSIGIEDVSDNVKKDFTKWLSSYNKISVREYQAKNILEKCTSKQISVHIDPTFLISKDEWSKLSEQTLFDKYVFLFSLQYSRELLEYAKTVSDILGVKLVYIAHNEMDFPALNDSIGILNASVTEWLGYIKNAEYVITNSFHGSAFSIIFEKKFKVYISNNRGSRIVNLLANFNLESCLIRDVSKVDIHNSIDFSYVQEKINEECRRTNEYLEF